MNAEVKMSEATVEQLTEQNKVVALFQFIEELNKLKQKSVINVNDYKNNNGWFFSLSNLPDDPDNITVLEPIAPQWADAIRSRSGIHGQYTVPDTIEDAWKWKQFSGIIDDITAKPFKELQADSLRLSKEYREVTAQYAEKSAWYNLLRRTESNLDMRMALQGWKQTVK